MNLKFKTKKDAYDYYDKHNPGMRKLNAHGDYKSDWSPTTNVIYSPKRSWGGLHSLTTVLIK